MLLFDIVFNGNDKMYDRAVADLEAAIAKYGEDKAVGFPETAYSLPCYYSETGEKIATLGEMKNAMGYIKSLMTRERRLDSGFKSGVATALCAEFIEALKYIDGAQPYELPLEGHFSDAKIRELGVPLVTGDIPGVAVIIGKAPTTQEAVDLVKSYQSQGIFVALVGECCDQLAEAGYKTGFAVRVVPLGKEINSVIHIVSVALRAALIFGNVTPGDKAALQKYTFDRINAFVNAFGPLDEMTVACGAGAIYYGFPVVTNDMEYTPSVPKS